jgi:hypothetical protein
MLGSVWSSTQSKPEQVKVDVSVKVCPKSRKVSMHAFLCAPCGIEFKCEESTKVGVVCVAMYHIYIYS